MFFFLYLVLKLWSDKLIFQYEKWSKQKAEKSQHDCYIHVARLMNMTVLELA
jgi:hypothetical protein